MFALFFLLLGMAFGFGDARGKGDILHSAEHFFHLGRWKVGATATDVRTQRLVRRSAAGAVQAAGDEADDVLGVCRRRLKQKSSGDQNPTFDRAADFVTDDEVEVARPKQGALVELVLASGNNGTAGALVVPAAAGKVKLYAPDVTATPTEATIEAALKENVSIIGRLMADKDATSADKDALVEWGAH